MLYTRAGNWGQAVSGTSTASLPTNQRTEAFTEIPLLCTQSFPHRNRSDLRHRYSRQPGKNAMNVRQSWPTPPPPPLSSSHRAAGLETALPIPLDVLRRVDALVVTRLVPGALLVPFRRTVSIGFMCRSRHRIEVGNSRSRGSSSSSSGRKQRTLRFATSGHHQKRRPQKHTQVLGPPVNTVQQQ